jgi:hypothetical protein
LQEVVAIDLLAPAWAAHARATGGSTSPPRPTASRTSGGTRWARAGGVGWLTEDLSQRDQARQALHDAEVSCPKRCASSMRVASAPHWMHGRTFSGHGSPSRRRRVVTGTLGSMPRGPSAFVSV